MNQMRKQTRKELERDVHYARNQLMKLERVLRDERQMLLRHGPEKAFDIFQKYLSDSLDVIGRRG